MTDIVRGKRVKHKAIKVKSYGRLSAFLVLLLIVALALLLNSKLFDIAQITVYGNERFTSEQIISMAGIGTQTNILRLDEPAVKAAIQTQPYLEVLDIVRRIPNKVDIYVEERKPAIQIEYNGSFINSDKKGNMLTIESKYNPELIRIKGLILREIILGKKAETIDESITDAYQELLQLLEKHGLLSDTETIDFSINNDITMQLRSGFTVKVGTTAQLEQKMAYFNPAMKEIKEQGNTKGTLDLSVVEKPIFRPLYTPVPEVEDTVSPGGEEQPDISPIPEGTSPGQNED